jgi:hypothetical protein
MRHWAAANNALAVANPRRPDRVDRWKPDVGAGKVESRPRAFIGLGMRGARSAAKKKTRGTADGFGRQCVESASRWCYALVERARRLL